MYTVLRFTCDGSKTSLLELGEMIRRFPQIRCDGPDKGVPDRISCTVTADDDWSQHMAAIEQFLVDGAELVRWSHHRHLLLSFDIAIEPDDFEGLVGSFSFTPTVIKKVSDMHVDLTISVYK